MVQTFSFKVGQTFDAGCMFFGTADFLFDKDTRLFIHLFHVSMYAIYLAMFNSNDFIGCLDLFSM